MSADSLTDQDAANLSPRRRSRVTADLADYAEVDLDGRRGLGWLGLRGTGAFLHGGKPGQVRE
jgi:hypothetical protein